jgi:hypothetical protein
MCLISRKYLAVYIYFFISVVVLGCKKSDNLIYEGEYFAFVEYRGVLKINILNSPLLEGRRGVLLKKQFLEPLLSFNAIPETYLTH